MIHWRNAPVDIFYRIPFPHPETGWGDWSDEFYTVYPDGVAVRKLIGWTHVPRGERFWEWVQSPPILHAGQRPDEVPQTSPFISVAHLDGRARDFRWPPSPEDPPLPGANVMVVNYQSEYKPFLVPPDREPRIWLPRLGRGRKTSRSTACLCRATPNSGGGTTGRWRSFRATAGSPRRPTGETPTRPRPFRVGYERKLQRADLVVWFDVEAEGPLEIQRNPRRR